MDPNVDRLLRQIDRLESYLEIVKAERDAYRDYASKIVDIKAETLLLQPTPPIILTLPLRPPDGALQMVFLGAYIQLQVRKMHRVLDEAVRQDAAVG